MPPRLDTFTCCTLRVEAAKCPHACICILDCYIFETGRAGVLRLFQETDSNATTPPVYFRAPQQTQAYRLSGISAI
jgi:hypothetical protein